MSCPFAAEQRRRDPAKPLESKAVNRVAGKIVPQTRPFEYVYEGFSHRIEASIPRSLPIRNFFRTFRRRLRMYSGMRIFRNLALDTMPGAAAWQAILPVAGDSGGSDPFKLLRLILVILFLTASALHAQPSITSGRVLNTSGNQAKLSPGVVWVIYGKNLGPASLTTATGPNYPDSVGGTSVTFTPQSGGAPVTAKIWYSLATQVGGFLPSSMAPGLYNVRVTYNNQTSVPENVTVVARSMGIGTSNGVGTGPAQATIANVNGGLSLVRFTSGAVDFGGYHWILTPAHPGDDIVLWGTGGGADSANDTGGSSGDQTAAGNFKVIVNTRQITPEYAGAVAGYPGLWQINFHLPSDVALDCFAPLQVSAGGEVGNMSSLAIAAPGESSCSDPFFSQPLLAKLDAQQDIVQGAFALARIGSGPSGAFQQTVSGFFGRYTATAYELGRITYKFGSCEIYDRTFPAAGSDPAAPYAFLDAGSRLPLSGGALAGGAALGITATPTGPVYSFSSSGASFAANSFTLSGTGGSVVGAFNVTANFPASFQSPAWDSINSIDRSKPFTFSWTGSGFDQVYIQVNSVTTAGSNRRIVTMNCTVPAAPGSYTIPAEALSYLPPAPASGSSFGAIALEAQAPAVMFTAPLVSGGQTDYAGLAADFGFSKNVVLQ